LDLPAIKFKPKISQYLVLSYYDIKLQYTKA